MPDIYLKEEPRQINVVDGQQVYALVGYDVKAGKSWVQFRPAEGSIPTLIGDPPKQDPYFKYFCEVEWKTEDGESHRGKIEVTPFYAPPGWELIRK